jgi:hypothetical protein
VKFIQILMFLFLVTVLACSKNKAVRLKPKSAPTVKAKGSDLKGPVILSRVICLDPLKRVTLLNPKSSSESRNALTLFLPSAQGVSIKASNPIGLNLWENLATSLFESESWDMGFSSYKTYMVKTDLITLESSLTELTGVRSSSNGFSRMTPLNFTTFLVPSGEYYQVWNEAGAITEWKIDSSKFMNPRISPDGTHGLLASESEVLLLKLDGAKLVSQLDIGQSLTLTIDDRFFLRFLDNNQIAFVKNSDDKSLLGIYNISTSSVDFFSLDLSDVKGTSVLDNQLVLFTHDKIMIYDTETENALSVIKLHKSHFVNGLSKANEPISDSFTIESITPSEAGLIVELLDSKEQTRFLYRTLLDGNFSRISQNECGTPSLLESH